MHTGPRSVTGRRVERGGLCNRVLAVCSHGWVGVGASVSATTASAGGQTTRRARSRRLGGRLRAIIVLQEIARKERFISLNGRWHLRANHMGRETCMRGGHACRASTGQAWEVRWSPSWANVHRE